MTREQIAAAARAWLGTPWQHQAEQRGVGCDCAGLVRGVLIDLGLMPADVSTWPQAARWLGYARQPDGRSLVEACAAFLRPIAPADARPGDVVVMRFATRPQHVGLLVPYEHGGLALLHAWNGSTVRSVVEHRLDARWRDRVTHAFALPGVA